MTVFSLAPGRSRRTILAAVGGGLAGGALVPVIGPLAGSELAHAAFCAAVVGTVLVVRSSRGIPARVAIGASAGIVSASLERFLPASAGAAVTGLGIGLALAPEGFLGGSAAALFRACAAAVGALVGAAALGSLAHLEPFRSSSPAAWGTLLGGALALGAAAGEAMRSLVFVPRSAPGEVEEARERLTPAARRIVETARSSYLRACKSVEMASTLDPHDRAEILETAKELVLASTRAALLWDELGRAQKTVGADLGDLRASTPGETGSKLRESRERIDQGLAQQRTRAHDEAVRAATALTELALAAQDRSAPAVSPGLELEARAQGLATRVAATRETGEETVDASGALPEASPRMTTP